MLSYQRFCVLFQRGRQFVDSTKKNRKLKGRSESARRRVRRGPLMSTQAGRSCEPARADNAVRWTSKPANRLPYPQYSVFSNCSTTVTVSPSGPPGLFKGVTTAMSGVLARFPLLVPVRNSCASYGAFAVARTPGRGHVAEVKNQCHRGFPPAGH